MSTEKYPWREPLKLPSRGTFIVVEGLDRAGKTTQVEKLCDRLYKEGNNVKALRFPDRTTPMGKMIDSYLQSKTEMDDHAIHLLFSANRWEKAKWIRENLAEGYNIVCDRYIYSGMIYSSAKQNPSLSLEWAKSPDIGLPRPDLVLFLDLSPEEARKRGGFGEERYEKAETQRRVKQLFLLLKELGHDEAEDMEVIDAGRSIEAVEQSIWEAASLTLQGVAKGHSKIANVRAWPQEILSKIPVL